MAIDAGTAALIGVGGTTTAALLGVAANLRIGKDTASVNKANVERQQLADDRDEQDRAFVRLEKENERLTAALTAERAAHDATRQELLKCREDTDRLWSHAVDEHVEGAPARKRTTKKAQPRRGRKP